MNNKGSERSKLNNFKAYAVWRLLSNIVCMYVFNFFRDAILISYTAGFHEGRLFSYLQVYKNEEKTN
jgi:hypothetical protein